MKRIILPVILLTSALALAPYQSALAREAVLFVTDWSNSMNGRAEGLIRRRSLVPEIAQAYFEGFDQSNSRPMVGLITFGDTGRWDVPADELTCEKDVTQVVPLETDFVSSKERIPEILAKTAPRGFTPIFSAIEAAAQAAGQLLAQESADSVRIILITDLADVCDARGGYRKLGAEEYCDLGTELGRTVSATDERYHGVVKLEFVVAVGENRENIGQIAECAKASSLAANTVDEARQVGKTMARRHSTPITIEPSTTTLRFIPQLVGGGDAFGRPSGTVAMAVRTGSEIQGVTAETQLTRPRGTVAKVDIQLEGKPTGQSIEVTFQTSQTIHIPWRLPVLSIVAIEDQTVQSGNSIAIVRNVESGNEIQKQFFGRTGLNLLPGTYELVVGFASGGWEKRRVDVSFSVLNQEIVFKPPPLVRTLSWISEPGQESYFPGPISIIVDRGKQQAQLPFNMKTSQDITPKSNSIALEIQRAENTVWTKNHSSASESTIDLYFRGGNVWVTAESSLLGGDSLWRLTDLNELPPTATYFLGDLFAQPLFPGRYKLSLNGTDVCSEGKHFYVQVGRPISFGSTVSWPEKGVCE